VSRVARAAVGEKGPTPSFPFDPRGLLGYLYPPDALPTGETFDGVANHPYSNPGPDGPVAAHVYTGPTDTIMSSPNPDPGEEYPHVNTQPFGTVDRGGENSWVVSVSRLSSHIRIS